MVRTLNLFLGHYSPAQARAFVNSTGARFAVRDCNTSYNGDRVDQELSAISVTVRRFGCATVYRLH